MDLIPWTPKVTGVSAPFVKISEDSKNYAVKARFPGMESKDIKISVHDGTLVISGQKKQEIEEKKKNSYYKETRYASFSRNLPLGSDVDKGRMKSKFEHGVFTMILPKKQSK